MELPVILYDIDNQKVLSTQYIRTHTFYFRSYRHFDIEVIEGNGILYSVKQIDETLETKEGTVFKSSTTGNNYGYTIYITEDQTETKVKVSNEFGYETIYAFRLKLDNQYNSNYNDLLTNNNLPNFEELEPALIDGFDKSELVKRLLLDFKHIIKSKGTKASISRFFQFIGYQKDNLTIFDEYLNLRENKPTTTPDKSKDIKTGNYHILYDNYNEEGLDSNNLPIRKIVIQDLDNFATHLLYAISLANTYFTLKEQDINFFGINYSTNIAYEPSITSNMSMIFEHDVVNFRKNLHIDLWTHITDLDKNYLISNCLQTTNTIYRSEVKTYSENYQIFNNTKIYLIDREIFDNEVLDPAIDITKISRVFGSVFHLKIYSPETYIEFQFIDKINPLSRLTFDNTFIDEFLYLQFVIKNPSDFNLQIIITDKYNNKEYYFYDMSINNNIQRIDFDTFNSIIINDDMKEINGIDLDVDTPSIISNRPSQDSTNYILPSDLVPYELSDYYNVSITDIVKWLNENKTFVIPEINENFQLDSITETISLEFIENWTEICSVIYDDAWELKLKVYDVSIYDYKIIPYDSIGEYREIFDALYITLMDIASSDNLTVQSYYFITTNQTGISMTKSSYDFVLVNKITGEVKSIYDELTYIKRRIPVNYDYPLFNISSDLFPAFNTYISPSEYMEKYTDSDINTYPVIRSIFPRLISTNIASTNDTFYLKLGDLFFCRLNDNYIVEEKNISWKVYNAFTKELLFETTDATLKYRINDNTIFDVICNFTINDNSYQIYKESLFSSFVKHYFD